MIGLKSLISGAREGFFHLFVLFFELRRLMNLKNKNMKIVIGKNVTFNCLINK